MRTFHVLSLVPSVPAFYTGVLLKTDRGWDSGSRFNVMRSFPEYVPAEVSQIEEPVSITLAVGAHHARELSCGMSQL